MTGATCSASPATEAGGRHHGANLLVREMLVGIARVGTWNAAMIGGIAYVVAMAVVMLVMRPIDEVPDAFSAVVLWRFRLVSLGIGAVLWTALGLVFGAVAERCMVSSGRHVTRSRFAG